MGDQRTKKLSQSFDLIAREYSRQSYEENLALPLLKKFKKLLGKNLKVLDIGCGGGQDSFYLAENNCDVLGIDISEEMIRIAKENVRKAKFMVGEFLDYEFGDEKFDGVWCHRMFHHIPLENQEKFIKKIYNILKSGGILYLSSKRSGDNDSEGWDDDAFKEYKERVGKNVKIFRKSITEKSFKNLLIKNNFKIIEFNIWDNKKWMDAFCEK